MRSASTARRVVPEDRANAADADSRPGNNDRRDESSLMTAREQLALWAAAPNDEVFVWMQYPNNDEIFVNRGFGEKPYQLGRMRAGDVLAAVERTTGASKSIARDVLSRFQKIADDGSTMRVEEVKGVACVIVEGKSPASPHAPYRVLLSSVESFT